ncbi:MAG: nuclear transport factor 2 family protein [Sphingomonadales bacterium]|nr:nuclear transport factor 2 family protein [Sphingomonadales bacterium]MDE2568954.1 nuclear transport factor 2 family protein [Sphingomonadales bacterium]
MTQMPEDVRNALERLLIDYCYAVDGLEDVQPLLDVFTDDAKADLTAIGLPMMNSKADIKAFFDGVFETMSHHFHFISNFRPASWDGSEAAMDAYVIGMGRAKDGNTVTVQVKYRMVCVQQGGAWKCRHYTITPMMPLPGSLDEIHGEN